MRPLDFSTAVILPATVQLVRRFAESHKVPGSIPYEATGFFNCCNPSSDPMALGFNQPLTEMSNTNLPVELSAADAQN
jgi:hypothetical protein